MKIITDALRTVGLQPGDTALVHTGLRAIMEVGGCDYFDDAAELLLSCLLDVVGDDGTILVPTFTYSFCQGKPFDHAASPSEVGPFTNYVREHPKAYRSFHPIFSFAGVGKDLLILRATPNTSFGLGSVFNRLHRRNALMLFVGCSFASCTFVHYVEQALGVSYRYLKEFTGDVTFLGHSWRGIYDFYARDLDLGLMHNFGPLGSLLYVKDELREAVLPGRHYVLGVRCNDVYDTIAKRLPDDPLFLTKREAS